MSTPLDESQRSNMEKSKPSEAWKCVGFDWSIPTFHQFDKFILDALDSQHERLCALEAKKENPLIKVVGGKLTEIIDSTAHEAEPNFNSKSGLSFKQSEAVAKAALDAVFEVIDNLSRPDGELYYTAHALKEELKERLL